MGRYEQMVQRPAEHRIIGIECWVEAAANTRIPHPRHLSEQARRARPGDVVQVAHDDSSPAILPDSAPYQHELGIPLSAIISGQGRFWM